VSQVGAARLYENLVQQGKADNMMSMKRGPDPEQMEALRRYAREKGRYWKESLRLDWYNADPRIGGEVSGELQQLRNELGPRWLNRFRMPAHHRTK
jgi:hypothetical protein